MIGRTTLSSHIARPGCVALDRLLVFDKGKVVEERDHQAPELTKGLVA
ncbi:hypothetical protein [Rhizobium bangladeshense]|nr:hypothetical protein [Rhizobium bangladeshense]MBX4888778.1 hypothetical protein [Rhizobium bangladeshense]MBX4919407.1 hypothetical protein [Rhizobium bangladeshense]